MRKALFRKYSLNHRSDEKHHQQQQHIEEANTRQEEPVKIEEEGEEEDSFSRFLKDERTKMFRTAQRTIISTPEVRITAEEEETDPHHVHNEDTIILLDTPTVESREIIGNGEQLEEDNDQGNIITEVSVAEATAAEPPVMPEEKTNEWIRQTEYARDFDDEFETNEMLSEMEAIGQPYLHQDSLEEYQALPHDTNNNNVSLKGSNLPADEDRTLSDLLNQVAELDEIYTDHQIRRNLLIEKELASLENAFPRSKNLDEDQMDVDELFDDAATYSSLQKAFKNPIDLMPLEINTYDVVEPLSILSNPPGPMIDVSPLKRENLEEEKLPPLPPKRKKPPTTAEDSPSSNKENKQSLEIVEGRLVLSDSESMAGLGSIFTNSRRSSTKSLANRPQSQIIIMKSPDGGLTPPTKSLPPTPYLSHSKSSSTSKLNNTKVGSTASLPKHKKPGFFSKLFSRRKSKSELADSKSMTELSRNGAISPVSPARSSDEEYLGPAVCATRFNRSLKVPTPIHHKAGRPVGRSVSSVSGKRPNMTPDIVHIPLKGDSTNSLHENIRPFRSHHTSPRNISSYSIADDRKTMSALQLADLPLQEGNMELIAIADAQSLKNLCEGEYGVQLDPSVDLTEAEHYALYTSVAPHATSSEFDETSAYYAPVEAGEILTAAEVANRLKSTF